MGFVHHHTLAQQRGLQVNNVRAQSILLVRTTADVVVKESRESGLAFLAIVINVCDDHSSLSA